MSKIHPNPYPPPHGTVPGDRRDAALQAVLERAREVFGALPRPAHFTNHTHCCECAEHDRTLAAYDPATIPREALGTMGWDPVSFTTEAAFRYYLPGLIRVVLTAGGEEEYFEQFLWHVHGGATILDRRAACTGPERAVVAAALQYLLEHRADEVEAAGQAGELLDAIARWP